MNIKTRLADIHPAFIPLLALLSLPFITFYYVGVDFNALAKEITRNNNMSQLLLEAQLQACVRGAVLQWVSLSLSAITVLLGFIQYHVTHDTKAQLVGILQIPLCCILLFIAPIFNDYPLVYSLKLIASFAPFSYLIIRAVITYQAMLVDQNTLRINEQKLRYIADHDDLTHCYNRRKCEDALTDAIQKSAQRGDFFALFVIDIDNFKTINDTLGHKYGDHLIKHVATQLSLLTRQGDIFSRLGGDEFALMTTKLHAPSCALKLAERIIKNLNIPSPVKGGKRITISMGIAVYPIDADNTADLLKHADLAMYKAKKAGKNTYRFYKDKLNQPQKAFL